MKFKNILALIVFFITAGQLNCYKYTVSICAMFQDEALYLKEWIEFHKLAGVSHFYLYNNFSTDNYAEVLAPYIEKNEVEVIEWPMGTGGNWAHVQASAFKDGVTRAKGQSKWLAFLDLDEFLFATKENDLGVFLKDYEEFGGVCANWVLFGTSFIAKIPENQLLIDALRYRAPMDTDGHRHIKSIVRPERVINCRLHDMIYVPGYFQVTPSKIKFDGPKSPTVETDLLRINHYWSRDEFYLENQKLPRRAKWGDKDIDSWRNLGKIHLNIEVDTTILHFVPALQKAVFN